MIRSIALLSCLLLLGFNAQAVTIDPSDCNNTHPGGNCWTAATAGMGTPNFLISSTGTNKILDAFAPIIGGLTEIYKADSASGSSVPMSETGALAGSYTTSFEFIGGGENYRGATVSYDGGNIVNCNVDCFLLVKDGNNDPAAYLFNLALTPNWNGTMDLVLENFWVGNGSISHIAFYGDISPIPVPAAFWLFGTALIGFIGISRRRSI